MDRINEPPPLITLISTIHEEHGKCNSDELCSILEILKPEVIFLEALDNTYSNYDKQMFENFGVYHHKLELAAIQKFIKYCPVTYISVLDKQLPESFNEKYDQLDNFNELKQLFENQNKIIEREGFDYLNSSRCTVQNEELRELEVKLLNDSELEQIVRSDIDEYENSMMRNIQSYCSKNQFNNAVFMCGVAHRKSIISKIEQFSNNGKREINWKVYGN
ncbi:MAG: hypothetical protein JJ966_07930 [Balneolaceae bacterium]|nr:hypothetical protein [Balneolaceae bacterium]